MRQPPVRTSKPPELAEGEAPGREGAIGTGSRVTDPPRWVLRLVPDEGEPWQCPAEGMSAQLREVSGFALVSVVAADSRRLGAADLAERAREAYRLIRSCLDRTGARHPVRLWNFIPGILEPLDDLPHRYMAFNAGRYRAYREWCDGSDAFPRMLAAASGVGHGGKSLIVHCLASPQPGTPVENPNQVPSYRYSSRYGPLPPCFARATRVSMDGGRRVGLLVGGTASVRGEDSVHAGGFHVQTEQTLRNLSSLAAAATRGMRGGAGDGNGLDPLAFFRSLRVYHPRAEHRPAVLRMVQERFPAVREVEIHQTDLCRPELLVEIEGVADLGPAAT